MAIPHAKPAQPIDVAPFGNRFEAAQTATLIKTESIEVIRLVVPKGKEIGRHQVPGEITLQCLEGSVALSAGDAQCELTAGKLLYLPGSVPHSLRAIENSSLLLTILL